MESVFGCRYGDSSNSCSPTDQGPFLSSFRSFAGNVHFQSAGRSCVLHPAPPAQGQLADLTASGFRKAKAPPGSTARCAPPRAGEGVKFAMLQEPAWNSCRRSTQKPKGPRPQPCKARSSQKLVHTIRSFSSV